MDVTISSKKSLSVSYRRIVTILNEAGDKHVRGYVGYNDGVKVREVSARIYDAGGELIKKLKRNDFTDISAVDGGSLYTDSRALLLNYFPIEYPYTVDFEYKISSNNTGTIPYWYFLSDFLVSVEKSRYSLTYSTPDLRPKIKEKNLEGFDVKKVESGNTIKYSLDNVKLVRDEALRPSLANIMPHILVAPTNFYYEGFEGRILDWEDAGQWMNSRILKGCDVLNESAINHVRGLVSGIEDDLEKAKVIFDFVQENTRYISVQVGIGGIRPIVADEVDRVKYGDCKGLSNYTKSLLAAVGVESYYVHVEAGMDKVDFEEDFASLAQGNHVILALPYNGEYYWLDSTSQTIPFGYIADFTDDRNVLVMKPEGGELMKTIAYQEEENLQRTTGQYSIDASGNLKAKVSIKTNGIQYGNHYFLEDSNEKDIKEYYQQYWNNINNLNLVSYDFKNNEEDIEFVEEISISAEKYASHTDNKLLFVANALNNQQYVPPRYRSRHFPFEVQRGFLDEDKYSIELPEDYEIESAPSGINLDSKYGSYQLDFSVENPHKIWVSRKMLLKKGDYPKEEYKEFRSFMRSVAKHDKSKIVVHKKTDHD
ncbi:DUF3857 domain-containing protein [Allomuricauda sp. SCSIO 65647]|uniref:DUF3857 domain-containing protein n=1 Tax=Allomuricauda sp. SCSIO 65647 TaxID=2908843 RepID=UPI001F3EF03D|nr:DUF3857 domain-containing protein [Muricauda sp. SCSIO 65647]UJH68231.1 DUF3857 domain-containing protein [Muricauda sp. SCSIO 65647]